MKPTSPGTRKDFQKYLDLLGALKEFHVLFNEQAVVNDRAMAIIGASFLDAQLESSLTYFFAPDEREVEELLKPDRPLGTFSSRTRIAYCLGLIGPTVRDDLRLVAKIRNRFAHRLDAAYDQEPVRSWCVSLKWHRTAMLSEPPPDATPRDYFQVGVNQLIAHLNGLVAVVRKEQRKIRQE